MSNIFFILVKYMTCMAKSYKDVKIPSELYFNIKEFIERHSELGYRSVSEFVNASSRNEMEKIEDRKKREM